MLPECLKSGVIRQSVGSPDIGQSPDQEDSSLLRSPWVEVWPSLLRASHYLKLFAKLPLSCVRRRHELSVDIHICIQGKMFQECLKSGEIQQIVGSPEPSA